MPQILEKSAEAGNIIYAGMRIKPCIFGGEHEGFRVGRDLRERDVEAPLEIVGALVPYGFAGEIAPNFDRGVGFEGDQRVVHKIRRKKICGGEGKKQNAGNI